MALFLVGLGRALTLHARAISRKATQYTDSSILCSLSRKSTQGQNIFRTSFAPTARRFAHSRMHFGTSSVVVKAENEAVADLATSAPAVKKLNKLAKEKSPYLLQHAANPVEWLPWGEEAFQRARDEDKPIFLSIGYSTCHWCHVMEHESFEDSQTAAIMNEYFVNIKVDCEERPDVNRVYMTYLIASQGSGGHPMSIFLTPDLKPFVGATYIPPVRVGNRMDFKTILLNISHYWKQDRAKLQAQGDHIIKTLSEWSARSGGAEDAGAGVVTGAALVKGFEQLNDSFDEDFGGFGQPPKFPRPSILNFLLRVSPPNRKEALRLATYTLQQMARGGMYDVLAGGFHRYSVDRWWHVPHFEKMLYDNAQLAATYLDAFLATGNGEFAKVGQETLDFVLKELTGSEGGFYSALDADSLDAATNAKREGAYYVWKDEQVRAVLKEDFADLFCEYYGVTPGGNCRPQSDPHMEFAHLNVLQKKDMSTQLSSSEEEKMKEARQRLLKERDTRPRPHLDDKIIVSWNGLMITAMCKGAQVLGDERYRDAAVRATEFILRELYDERTGGLKRSYREGPSDVTAFADDYAYLVQALLDLYETTFEVQWLSFAMELQKAQDERFLDTVGGGYFDHAGDQNVLLRMKEDYDGAEPSPTSVSALNLLKLHHLTGEASYKQKAEMAFKAFSERLTTMPGQALPQMLVAFDWLYSGVQEVVITGPLSSPNTKALINAAHTQFLPRRILIHVPSDIQTISSLLPERGLFFQALGESEAWSTPGAYVCSDFVCSPPVFDAKDLATLLNKNKEE